MGRVSAIGEYEQRFARWFGAERAFAFWKARVALYAILKAMGIGEGDEVILPGYTCVMNVNPIKYLGAKPVYVDIEPATYNMNPELLRAKITPKTKVIIVQHTYGFVCDMDAITNIADKNGITVIEDCCLSLGSKYKGRAVGMFGKAGYFSSQWNKPYTTGLGGMALVHDSTLAEKIESLCAKELCNPSKAEVMMLVAQLTAYRAFVYPRTMAFVQMLFRYLTRKGVVVGSSSTSEYEPKMAANFFKAMSNLQGRVGIKQLAKIDSNIAHRKKMTQFYNELFEQKGWSVPQYDRTVMEPVFVRYPVRIKEKNQALAKATSAGVELGSWFECPLHPIETPMEIYDYQPGMCPEAEKASREVVNLPVHPRAGEKTVQRSVEFITQFTQAD